MSVITTVKVKHCQWGIMDRMGDGPIFFHYSDDSKKNTFNNGGNNAHGLKNVTCKQTFNNFLNTWTGACQVCIT